MTDVNKICTTQTTEQPIQSIDPEDIYNISYWGEGYFNVSKTGNLEVQVPAAGNQTIYKSALVDILKAAQASDLKPPLLVRITNILGHRATRLCHAFAKAFEQLDIEQGQFTAIYPIKVNQQKRVIHEILSAQKNLPPALGVGLEAGSKPEFIAALCSLPDHSTPLICNGYKDEEYLRLAVHASELGFNVCIVIEKLTELETLIPLCKAAKRMPKLGVRIRLHSTGKGNWQNTGGDKGKFGLTAPQLIHCISQLKTHDWLDCLHLMHVHIGSQISDIQDLALCLTEVGRYYIGLHELGAKCPCLDVGGGLGIDYEGTASKNYHSINYSLEEYAFTVVNSIASLCRQAQVPIPHLLTESGRALTAHHAILLTNIVDTEQYNSHSPEQLNQLIQQADPNAEGHADSPLVGTLAQLEGLARTCQGALKPREAVTAYHQLRDAFNSCQKQFQAGTMNLCHKALAEGYFFDACQKLLAMLDPSKRAHQPIVDELNELLAHRLFLNFSLFQSTPDIWGIGQILPIMPISGLKTPPYVRARLNDLTCDSDGRIDFYVDGMGLETTLPLPAGHIERCAIVGIFLVGAYQEILGDLHNLFGDTNSVDVTLTEHGQFTLSNLRPGDTTQQVLSHVNFTEAFIREQLESKIMSSMISHNQRAIILKDFHLAISGSTYLS